MDLNKQALNYMKQNNFEKAAQLFTEHIDKNPKDAIGYINFGNLLLHLKDYEHATNFFNKAIELDEQAATAFYGLGNIAFEEEDYKKSRDKFSRAIELGLNDADVYYLLGMSLLYLEHNQLAIPYLLRATELAPNDQEKLFQYGLTLAQTDYLSEAELVFNKVLEQGEHSDAHYNLGVLAAYDNDITTALEHFEQSLTIQPDHMLAANGKKSIEEILNNEKQ